MGEQRGECEEGTDSGGWRMPLPVGKTSIFFFCLFTYPYSELTKVSEQWKCYQSAIVPWEIIMPGAKRLSTSNKGSFHVKTFWFPRKMVGRLCIKWHDFFPFVLIALHLAWNDPKVVLIAKITPWLHYAGCQVIRAGVKVEIANKMTMFLYTLGNISNQQNFLQMCKCSKLI